MCPCLSEMDITPAMQKLPLTLCEGRRSYEITSQNATANKICLRKEVRMMEKLIITAAICGAEVTKENSPAVPYTVEEMVREAKSAYDAGAAVIHVHVRWDDGTPRTGNGSA